MSKSNLCPCCQQPLPAQVRAGVYLPPKKAAIFDTIADNPGITVERLIAKLFDGGATVNTIYQHIHQINALLASTDIQISGNVGHGQRGCYWIVRQEVVVPA